jgi:hypothetical protein
MGSLGPDEWGVRRSGEWFPALVGIHTSLDPAGSGSPEGGAVLLPRSYRYGMSKQAPVISDALERERRRVIAARDAQILARTGPDPELLGLAEYAVGLSSLRLPDAADSRRAAR